MKKLLLLLVAACTMLGVSAATAQERGQRPIKVCKYRNIEKKDVKAKETLVTPKGELKYYAMSCVVRDFGDGLIPVLDVANELYFSADGQTIYFGSLFPGVYFCDELWAEGKVKNNKVTISTTTPVLYVDLYDEGPTEIYMGELLVDDWGNPYAVDNIEFNIDGDRIFLDYGDGMRDLALYYVDKATNEMVVMTDTYNNDMRLFTGNTTLNQPSKDAKIMEYIYNAQDANGDEYAEKGHVAIDGNDYYFDYLLPEATERSHAWIKGTRNGNTITLPNNQYLGHDTSYFMYYNGFKSQGIKDNYGYYKGDIATVTFNIDDNGIITLNNPNNYFPCAFYSINGNQSQFEYYNFRHRLEPYNGDQLMKPCDPEDVKINLKALEKYGEVSISFIMRNLSVDGSYLNPDNLYYNIYLDDDIYTFTKRQYLYIAGDSMTDIPYAYKDGTEEFGGYDIYLADDGRNVACLYEDMFTRLGVQVIYKVDGKESRSNIVYQDKQGNTEVVVPGTEGIDAPVSLLNGKHGGIYDLQGRKASKANRSLSISDGKVVLMK